MTKGLLFGKFMPFHKGHEAMLRFALKHCDSITVLVCRSNKEQIDGNLRKKWIEDSFRLEQNLSVELFNYSEDEFPNTSVSSRAVSAIWAKLFKEKYPKHKLIISSEPYGEFVASYMGIKHLSFDQQRQEVAISATAIRKNLLNNWDFLPKSVKAYYCTRVVLLGTESTGKSSLSKRLADYYNASLVPEVGRTLIPDSKAFEFKDLQKVAQVHAENILTASTGDAPILIIDTDIHITKSYAKFIFNQELDVAEEIYHANKAHLYLYLSKSAPYIQDGTRLNLADRNRLDHAHKEVLKAHNIRYIELDGNWEQQFLKAIEHIDKLLARRKNIRS